MEPSPPSPKHILRSHSNPITCLFVSKDNRRIYSGDFSGKVVVTSSSTIRSITSWKAHEDGLLGVQEWNDSIITQARDNKLHVWSRILELPEIQRIGGSATLTDLPLPTLRYSLDVNALNYCRFSLLPVSSSVALIAVPNLVESSEADIWSLPSCERIHAAIGRTADSPILSTDGRGTGKTGIIMSLHLFTGADGALRLLTAYESGSTTLRSFLRTDKITSVEGIGWDVIWSAKLHAETIMAMRVSADNKLALTISADHIVGKYDLTTTWSSSVIEVPPPETGIEIHRTRHPGNSSIAIRDDGKVCAIGGWDGKIRLYSTKSLKPLGTLRYHKSHVQAVEFVRSTSVNDDDESDDEGLTPNEKDLRARWLISGGKDGRVSIWELIVFRKN